MHFSSRIGYRKSVSLCLFCILSIVPATSFANEPQLFRIGTGGRTGVYYPIGKIIAQGLTSDPTTGKAGMPGENGVPGFIGVAQNSAGSVDNVRGVTSGEIEAGLVQADVAAWALDADRSFKGNDQARSIRAIASLYPEKFHIVCFLYR